MKNEQVGITIEEIRDKVLRLGIKVDDSVPNPNIVPAKEFDARAHFGMIQLKDTDRSHWTAVQNQEYDDLLSALRSWHKRRKTNPEASFVLLGNPGRGKTRIAECVFNAFCVPVFGLDYVDTNDVETYISMERYARFMTASELMVELAERTFSLERRTRLAPDAPRWTTDEATKLFVIDEIGEESRIPWTSSHFASQEGARKDYYFQFFDKLVKRRIGFFATSNFTDEEFFSYFTDKTSSRLKGMIGAGHVFELEHLPDFRPFLSGRDSS